ncbi:tetratricopeptide repeat protein [Niastella caeni]|uniref:Tetratricopeptide repeat protein n=1 Tax=Niastella caeni TaxID=2569763 RepID=A0A4S8HZH9_9BACT|nr:tetratricopeptide repeat protein [Niastella caeni]THU41258.1 tetratricopeptide repeat protein [Niastella caeni]
MSKRFISFVTMVVLGSNVLFAQSVEQGRKFFYYERYKSARENFEKVLAANPNNIDATYWLGQTLLEQKDSVGAKNLYQKALQQNGNAPLILVGMGEIELREGKTNDARQRFETAISLTKGKDVEVFNAIGRANVDAKNGDATYAIEKLNLATQVKGFKDPETYILIGDAYRKLIDGGNAITSYNKAFTLDPKYAAAKHKSAKVYLTQRNPEMFLPLFEEAIKIDPAYAPTYFELFYYWYFKDVNKAAPYLASYTANADQGPDVEYLKTDFLYASGKFGEAKDKALSLISQFGDKVAPRMYKMVAYACDTLKDINCANKYIADYFAKQNPDDVLPADYEELANLNTKTPGSETQAFVNLQKAVDLDTIPENKVKYITKAAALAKKMGDRKQEANWLGEAYKLKKEPTQSDLYNWGYAHYQAANYTTADSIFCGIYQSKFPDQIYGYLWCARAKQAMDTAMTQGIAVAPYEKLAEMAAKLDSTKFKAQIVSAFTYLTTYYNDAKKDSKTALTYVDKILAIDPTNQFANAAKPVLQKQLNSRPAQPAPQPKRTGGSSSTTSKPGGAAKK